VDFLADCPDAVLHIWQVNDSTFAETPTASYTFDNVGTYVIKLYTSDGDCTNVTESVVEVGTTTASAGDDQTICINESVMLNASGGMAYTWTPAASLSDATIANPIAMPDTSTTYYVTITDSNGCMTLDSVQVWVSPLPVLLPVLIDTLICSIDTISLPLSDNTPISNYTYNWLPTTGLSCTTCPNPIATVTETTVYTLEITNFFGCMNSQTFTIEIINMETPLVQVDTTLCAGESYFAQGAAQVEAGIYYDTLSTIIGCDSIVLTNLQFVPSIELEQTVDICLGESYFVQGAEQFEAGEYHDTLSTVLGCDSLIITHLQVLDCEEEEEEEEENNTNILIPSAFSPNNDGVNDVFRLLGNNVAMLEWGIFNRWGTMVYQAQTNNNEGWDGTHKGIDQELGVYVYYVIITYTDNTTERRKGNVTLIR
jgi:gliding motility-associated-like protein